jgi:hypothetical protein
MTRQMRNPEKFEGKKVTVGKWIIPDGWAVCAMTGELYREADCLISFPHYRFDRQFLLDNDIYVEDAEWLSEKGYYQIVDVLERLGYAEMLWI